MYNQIRKIVKESMEGIDARILLGTVLSINPFKVSVDQRFELPKESMIFPEHLQEVKLVISDWKDEIEIQREYILKPKLAVNDKLILINLSSKYLVFDKVGDIDASIIITE
ncbi:MAG: DUF2577 family protein [Vulcanibacillus sp.]